MVLPVVCGVLLVEFTGQINSLYKRATNMFFFSSGVHSVQELDNAAVMEHYFSQWTANSNVLPSLPLVKANCSVLRCPRDIPMNSQIAGFSCIRTRILCDVYTYDTGVGFVSSCCSVQGRRSWYLGGFDHLKICSRGQSMFWLRKISHSFIQNCCNTLQLTQQEGWKTCVKNGR